jgi:hypothetical protein
MLSIQETFNSRFSLEGYRGDSDTLMTEIITRLGILFFCRLSLCLLGNGLQTRDLERLGMTKTMHVRHEAIQTVHAIRVGRTKYYESTC